MTLQTTGPISVGDIKAEFGGNASPALGDYYAGGTFVQAVASGTNGEVPSSGPISMSDLYGTSKESELSVTALDVSANADGFGSFTGNPEAAANVTPSGGSGSYTSFHHEYVSGDVLSLDPDGSVQNPGIYKSGGIFCPSLGSASAGAVFRVTVQDSEGHTASATYNVGLTCNSVND